MPYNETAYNTLKSVLDKVFDWIGNVTLPAFNTSDIYITLPSGLKLLICHVANNAYVLDDFRLPTLVRVEETHYFMGVFYHANLYPGQNYWINLFSSPFIATPVEIVSFADFPTTVTWDSNRMTGYNTEDLGKDMAGTTLLTTVLVLLCKQGFNLIDQLPDLLLRQMVTDLTSDTATVDTIVDDIQNRVKKLYAGSYV